MPRRDPRNVLGEPRRSANASQTPPAGPSSSSDHQLHSDELSTLSIAQFQALASADLSTHLRTRNLSVYGNKAQKAQCLYDHIHSGNSDDEESTAPATDSQDSLLQKVEAALDKHTKLIEDKLARWTSDQHPNQQMLLLQKKTTSPSRLRYSTYLSDHLQ